jgi:hypothetical protein
MNPLPFKISRAIILTTIFVLTSFLINAQIYKRDIVYLKNGSIIKGYILEVIPNESIKLKTSDGSIFIFKMEEVERTSKEEPPTKAKTVENEKNEVNDSGKNEGSADGGKEMPKNISTGYFLLFRFGPNAHVEPDASFDISAGIVNAYQINKFFSFGIGVEATSLVVDQYNGSTVTIFPIYLDTRFYIPRESVRPMFNFQFGYSFVGNSTGSASTSYGDFIPSTGNGGMFVAANAGMKIPISTRLSVLAEGGFSMQQLRGKTDYSNTETIEMIPSLRINVGLCVSLGSKKK